MGIKSIHLSAKHFWLLTAIALLSSGCSVFPPDDTTTFTTTFLLRSKIDAAEASNRIVEAMLTRLQDGQILDEGYPVLGHIEIGADPSDPDVDVMHCGVGRPSEPEAGLCILLNEESDFIRVGPITWPSANPFQYRVYVVRPSLLKVDYSTQDFVAIDPFVLHEADLLQRVDEAIRDAVAQVGGRPVIP